MSQDRGRPKFPTPLPNPAAKNASQDSEITADIVLDFPAQAPAPATRKPTGLAALPNPKSAGYVAVADEALASAPTGPAPKLPSLGVLDPLMRDPEVTEIMINDLRNVMIEKSGKMLPAGFSFQSMAELNGLIQTLLQATGKALPPEHPYLDANLADGSRVNIVAPPLTVGGPCITIRKHPSRTLSLEELVRLGMLDRKMGFLLNACTAGRLNILISGGTASGKTTLLNALTQLVPKAERVVSIEDTPELKLSHANSVRMQTKPPAAGAGAVTTRDLVVNALRMRPDRIIVGECRRGEAFDMLQAMNTGHEGSMTTIHANSPRDALARLETLCMLAGSELPLIAIRKQIASAIDLVVQIKRFRTGRRRVVAISELTGMEGDTFLLQDIFIYELDSHKGAQPSDRGAFKCTGLVPTFVERLREHGIDVPRGFFG